MPITHKNKYSNVILILIACVKDPNNRTKQHERTSTVNSQ